MRIAVSGATGFVGQAVTAALEARGDEVIRLVRREAAGADERRWSPGGDLEAGSLAGIDGVVHLAGRNIAEGRWTEERKKGLYSSRVDGTGTIARAAAGDGVKTLVCASAIGYYGRHPETTFTEESPPGDDFLSGLVADWERAAEPARDAGVRVVWLRIGVVLGPGGGALKKMLGPFRAGVGGRLGDGRQYMSWVTRDDVVGAALRALDDERWAGPVNVVAGAVTNNEFTKTLGRVLRRPTIFPLPAFMVKLFFGEMGETLLLGSTRVDNARLGELGYDLAHPELEEALRASIP